MNRYQLIAISVALGFSSSVSAVDLGHGLSFKAFGTVGAAYSDNDEADYITSTHAQPVGAGRSDDISYKVDTKVGAQLDWQATEQISLTTQLLSKQFEDKTWTPRVEAAYVKYQATPELGVRGGRIRPSVYMLSDFLDVNYANAWVRPPVEHYGVMPFTYMDGVDFLWRPQTGDVTWLIQPYLGTVKVDTAVDTAIDNDIAGIGATASQGDWSLRLGYMRDQFQFTGGPIDQMLMGLNGLCAVDPVACELARDLDSDDATSDYISLGASWDNGDYFVSGEYAKVLFDVDFVPEMSSYYLSGGARFDSWTPYLTYSQFKIDSSATYSGSDNAITNAMITGMRNSNMQGQHTLSMGVRYDFMPNLALKAQWDHVTTDCNDGQAGTCGGMFAQKSDGFTDESQDIDVVSLSLDFVF
ncbi:MAG: hypothetical protein ABW068_10615 [Candidatus Thiodiazotropha sp.]